MSLAVLPSIAFVLSLEIGSLLPAGVPATGEAAETVGTLRILASGFIITALLWGAAAAELIDQRFLRSGLYFFGAAALCLFGVIHSPAPQGTLFFPWRAGGASLKLAAGYLLLGLILLAAQVRQRGVASDGRTSSRTG